MSQALQEEVCQVYAVKSPEWVSTLYPQTLTNTRPEQAESAQGSKG